jgi:predicted Rossmann fold flavoprotein
VAVLERAERIGKKILISGGGRCNFTNLHCRPENFISANPHFAKSALARYTPADFISMVEKHSIAYHEKTLGQLFCDGAAQQIVAMLEAECRAVGVRIQTNVNVEQVSRENSFLLRATDDDEFRAESLVVATGGLSIPRMGATGVGYDLARQFGLKIVEPWPALVPLTLNKDDAAHFCDLAGVSTEVIASIGAQSFREKILITHRGLSGPAILQISSYWKPGQSVSLDLAPEQEVTVAMRDPKARRDLASAKASFRAALPNRFAERWLDVYPPQGWSNHALDELERRTHNWQVVPAGTEGYAKAEVTAGGVDTNELSARTMESRKVPGLYFIGEVVDVTGHLGGFNFQWAWASGFSAGRAA